MKNTNSTPITLIVLVIMKLDPNSQFLILMIMMRLTMIMIICVKSQTVIISKIT